MPTLDLLDALTGAAQVAETPEARETTRLIREIVATCHGTADAELIRLADQLDAATPEGRTAAAQALYEALDEAVKSDLGWVGSWE